MTKLKDTITGRFTAYIQSKDCASCGVSFKGRVSDQVFCTKRCYFDYKKKNIVDIKIDKTCKTCSKNYRIFPCFKNKSKFCSHKCYHKDLQESKKGINSPLWQGGISETRTQIRSCRKYKDWRTSIFERDRFTCRDCGKKSCKLNADHIKPFSVILNLNNIKTLEQALECKELWDTQNGQTLCEDCHKNTKSYLKNYKLSTLQLYV